MSIFVCDECNCLENTALSRYWVRGKDAPALCSQCDPEIGSWHGAFARELFDPAKHKVLNRGTPRNARDEFFGDTLSPSPERDGQGQAPSPAPGPSSKPKPKPRAKPKTRR